MLSIIFLLLTVFGYIVFLRIYHKFPNMLLAPGIAVPLILIILLYVLQVKYQQYMQFNQGLVWMIGPTTVAFALPIYEYKHILTKHFISISLGIVFGMLSGVLSSYALAQYFSLDRTLTLSLMTRSISTPFAMELANQINGSIELSILFTMLTGIAAVLVANLVFGLINLKNNVAQGAALGNAGHGFGTVKAFLRHTDEGVAACLCMILSGILMVFVGPYLILMLI
ncbi:MULTISPECIES: LrgB family protein [Acinetobacter]|uniref:LrgB family protein n=2 Tax=Acinetobacter TaxID=469 RepID=A0A2H9YNM0_9GAMM|nr:MULTISPECIES: LrgB family protein [Acinetobacter]MBS7321678.1 LrgB family protein [Myroides sp.]MDH5821306.1 LrgB family protein [Acinetobacter pseudolwoffii]PJO74217.1 LrgB family protein [Acinetobacter pseudolwoffii]UBX53977.1 LrgB family protein [Acinetobacter pseudolwoffii]